MDLIPRQYKQQNEAAHVDIGGGLKSRGISISGKGMDLSYLYKRWVLVSFGGFLLSVLVFGGLYGYNFYLSGQSGKLDRQIEQLRAEQKSQQNIEVIKNISDIDSTIATVNDLTSKHVYSSVFFEKLESLTLPQVQWSGVNMDCVAGAANLRGRAASYSYLAKQIVSFQDEKFQTSVSGISLGAGGVDFSATIKFNQKILLKQ